MNTRSCFRLLTLAAIASCCTGYVSAQTGKAKPATHPFHVPERAIIMTGDTARLNDAVYAVFYNTENLMFNDPSVPRFQLVDREGTTIFGVGGVAEGLLYYDFDGSVDGSGFVTYNIPVPRDAARRSQLGAGVSQSSIFMKLARATRVGILSVYLQAEFSGGVSGHDFNLKQAYISLAGVTAGLTNSVFSDPASGVPTVDPAGPPGAITAKNIQLSYNHQFSHNISGSLSLEMPEATNTLSATTATIKQRYPDIPLNVQYTWYSGSHIRAAAILRNLTYRDLVAAKNKVVTGWGVMVAGTATAYDTIDLLYQAGYGHGIGRYVHDFEKNGLDLIPDGEGRMMAPASFSFTTGIRFKPSKKLLISGSYGYCRLYDGASLGSDGFRRSGYGVVNAFYTPISDLQLGIEYLNGRRVDQDHTHGTANRIMAMIKYSF